MQLKLMLMLMAAAAGTMIGLACYKRGAEREKYFNDIVALAVSMICDIRFTQKDIVTLVNNFEPTSSVMKCHIAEFGQGIATGKIVLSRHGLKESEFAAVNDLFLNLGRFDSETQIFQLEGARDKLKLCGERVAERNKKYGKIQIKLGFMIGLAVGILLL